MLSTWVYPRVYGGTVKRQARTGASGGLSPRVRGNHIAARTVSKDARSIPACTGEPYLQAYAKRRAAVYPRVYGGTAYVTVTTAADWGLSPRVRGNPTQAVLDASESGSIPACTGEPRLVVGARHSG